MTNNTIYALSTVFGKSGVAVIRISGDKVLEVVSGITNIKTETIKPRFAYFTNIINPKTKEVLDKSLVVYFKAPYSFTGEDILEIQCHGSKAVLNSVLNVLSLVDGVRLAEPGEFSKRAFYNNKMDLTEAEGLADLIDAETSEQQKYALRQLSGGLKNLYTSWRQDLVRILSYLEAFIDFPEEDIPSDLSNDILNTVFKIKNDITLHLKGNNVNERLRSGFRIVITGAPNAGKSSLINTLVKRNAVIVSDIEGTTRDAIDINLDISGYPVIITDTAGIRDTQNPIEQQGVEIAKEKVSNADIVINLYDASNPKIDEFITNQKVIYVANKIDKLSSEQLNKIPQNHLKISAKYNQGVDNLVANILDIIKENFANQTSPLITRTRYREALNECLIYLDEFSLDKEIELSAEDIRLACRSIGKITGHVEVDEILDNIFGSFCIGK